MSKLGKSHTDEVPCRSCTSFTEYMKQSKKRYASEVAKTESEVSNKKNNLEYDLPLREDCPADSNLLGKSTWIFLHTMAAKYPATASVSQQKDMITFLNIFAKFYPCSYCAEDLRKEMKNEPPKTKSQEELSQWMCRLHNKVNLKLGKKEFDCSKVNERWRDGWLDGSCG